VKSKGIFTHARNLIPLGLGPSLHRLMPRDQKPRPPPPETINIRDSSSQLGLQIPRIDHHHRRHRLRESGHENSYCYSVTRTHLNGPSSPTSHKTPHRQSDAAQWALFGHTPPFKNKKQKPIVVRQIDLNHRLM
jgi:hypothetical protein